jgi:hypothetical protein
MSKVLRRGQFPLYTEQFIFVLSFKLAPYFNWKTFSICLTTFHETVKFYEHNTLGNAEKTINIWIISVLILSDNQTVRGNEL